MTSNTIPGIDFLKVKTTLVNTFEAQRYIVTRFAHHYKVYVTMKQENLSFDQWKILFSICRTFYHYSWSNLCLFAWRRRFSNLRKKLSFGYSPRLCMPTIIPKFLGVICCLVASSQDKVDCYDPITNQVYHLLRQTFPQKSCFILNTRKCRL